jgi:nitrogen fixation/metabolism regulation signal transduction histidine kinase
MVDEFREYARRPPLSLGSVDLNQIIDEVLTLYGWEPRAATPMSPTTPTAQTDQHTKIDFDIRLTEDLPKVQGDATRLRQVVHNLLANARDALGSAATGAQIKVSTDLVTASIGEQIGQPAVRLIVSDNGPGFSAQLLQRAFEPYITTKAHGTGLGLAIVRKIVEEHGGYIDVSNRRAGGARVTILLKPDSGEVDDNAQEGDNHPSQ